MKKRSRIALIVVSVAVVILLTAVVGDVVSARLRTKPIYGVPLGGPAPTPAASTYSFAFTGDTRNNNSVFDEIIRESMGQKCVFGVYGGDMVKGSSDWNYDDFCRSVVKATGGRFPIYPVIGNHDWSRGILERLEGERFVRYLGPEDYGFWYGRDAFVLFDDSRPEGITAARAATLEKMLQAVRPKARHVFLVCHIPPFDPDTTRNHCLGPASAKRLMGVAAKCKVTLVLASHVHGFGEKTIDGVPVLISGGAGAKLVSNGRFNWVKITVDDKSVTPQMVELPAEFQTPEKDIGGSD